jgi:hypothetical protein
LQTHVPEPTPGRPSQPVSPRNPVLGSPAGILLQSY